MNSQRDEKLSPIKDENIGNDSAIQHGAIVSDDGIKFSIWAPDALQVDVKFDDDNLHALNQIGDGWFTKTIETKRSIKYRFVIDNKLDVPDPASRAQVDDVTGWSSVVDHSEYVWKNESWKGRPWQEAIFYEMHVGILGGFAKVESTLSDLATLGITAIELMPINEFPGARNWGYDGALPFAPEHAYGTPDELKSLIDTAHSLGIMVFIDVVYNHFGPVGNYLHEYAKGFFRDDIHTPWGAAIDFRRPQVRNFFIENAEMWIRDYRVDGLRLDAVHAISEKDFLVEFAERVRAAAPNRHIHLVLENEDNSAALLEQGFNAQWNDDAHNVLHAILTNEEESYYSNYVDSQTEKLARYLAEGFIYQGEKSHRGQHRGEPSGHLSPTSFVVFLQNHDQVGNRAFGERLIELADENAVKSAAALTILSPMIPLLFMGEENGSRQPFYYFTDHPPEMADLVRDGRRNEFSDLAAFKSEEMRNNIPDPNHLNTFINSIVDCASDYDSAWRAFYKNLLTIRYQEIIPRLTNVRCEGATIIGDRAVVVSWKMSDGSVLTIALNLSNEPVDYEDEKFDGRLIFSNGCKDADENALPPGSIKVFIS
jgi:maltooligosyltrehalose trehalohydrolase